MACNETRLQQLLTADESSSEYQLAANHVESCSRCQQRLAELSGDNELLNEVRATLRACGETAPYRASVGASVLVSIDANGSDDSGAECEPISLAFLDSPSHPEMLGRIGRYDVERMIGSGGMGIVLKGFDTELHRVVAIKVLKPHLADNGAARRRFAREAQSAAAVVHEHVIPIHDVQSDGDLPFLVMQYVPGPSLQARVDERGPLEAKEVLRIARQIATGLAAAHAQGLVHRDVKPANILLEQSVERVLISDFGLARTVDDATLTRTGIVAGTPHYMSPEQAGGRAVDSRSDLFSLGSVLYFMCTGRPPFRADQAMAILNRICHDTHRPVDEVNPDVPAELAETIDRLLAKDPGDRFRNADEVAARLGSILAGLQQGRRSRRSGWRRRWLRWRSTTQKVLFGILAASVCVLAGLGLGRWQGLNPQQVRTEQALPDLRGEDGSTARDTSTTPASNATKTEFGISQATSSNVALTGSRDNFHHEVANVRSKISQLEDHWNRPSADAATANNWQQDLEQVQTILGDLEQSFRELNNKTDSKERLPVERNDR